MVSSLNRSTIDFSMFMNNVFIDTVNQSLWYHKRLKQTHFLQLVCQVSLILADCVDKLCLSQSQTMEATRVVSCLQLNGLKPAILQNQ